MNKADRLVEIAQALVDGWPDFFAKKGPGLGDKDTGAFMEELRARARSEFGQDFAERKICGETSLSVDYHFPDEATIIEIAMGLRNSNSEYETDLLKAIMALEAKHEIRRLVFLTKPGGIRTCSRPGRRAFADWLERQHGVSVEIREFSPMAEKFTEPTDEEEA